MHVSVQTSSDSYSWVSTFFLASPYAIICMGKMSNGDTLILPDNFTYWMPLSSTVTHCIGILVTIFFVVLFCCIANLLFVVP